MPTRRVQRGRGRTAPRVSSAEDCVAPVAANAGTGRADPAKVESKSYWRKYPSINDADLAQVDMVRKAVQGREVEFVAVEKVHGSNFAFETNGHDIEYFSRNRRLDKGGSFVGRTKPGEAMQAYHTAVMEVFRLCGARASGAVGSVLVYGEYFGGWYPHQEVQSDGAGAGAAVQRGVVAYAPSHQFFAFDVVVDGTYLDFDDATDLLTRAGFPLVATAIRRGSFEDCMSFDVENFQTTIPGILGLPLCEEFSIAEGVIVRPTRRFEKWTIKRKSLRYLETCPDEFQKWAAKCVESKERAVEDLYLCLCRRPRLDAVLSKEPQLRMQLPAALPRVQALFRDDVEEALQQKLTAVAVLAPSPHRLEQMRAEADSRVEGWLLEEAGKD